MKAQPGEPQPRPALILIGRIERVFRVCFDRQCDQMSRAKSRPILVEGAKYVGTLAVLRRPRVKRQWQ